MTEATKIRQVPPPPPKQAEGAKQSNSCQGDDVHITPSSTPLKGAEIWSPMACSPMMVSPVAKPDSVEPDARDSSGEGAGYQNMVDELREQLASMEQQSADADGTDPCEGGDADLNLLSLEQYEEAVQAGEINAYSEWTFSRASMEKVANLVRKEELHRALNHALESSLKETLSKAEASASQTHSQGKSLFIVFDTNCFLDAQSLEQVKTFMDKLKRRHRVLDNLKKVEDTKEAGASQEVPSYKRMLLP
eukprot:gene11200-13236_t